MSQRKVDKPRFGRNFNLFWSGQAINDLGSMITIVALPLVVVLRLHGSTFDVGLVEALEWLPTAIISLPVGAWADRRHKRPLLILSNIGQAMAIGTVPLLAAVGGLTFGAVLVVAAVTGVFNMLFQLSYSNYLRSLVAKELLQRANSRFQATGSATRVGGPGVAGILVSAFGAPFALIGDACSFIVSAVTILSIRVVEPEESRSSRTTPYRAAIREGISFVFADPLLRSLVLSMSLSNFCLTAIGAIEIPYLARNLSASPAAIGTMIAIGALGGIAGAIATPYLVRTLGNGRLVWLEMICSAPFVLLLPAAGRGGTGLAIFVLGLIVGEAGITIGSIIVATFRQTYCPHEMLSRVSASVQTLQVGIVPVGAVAGGSLAAWLGNHAALWALCIANLTPALWRLLSPFSRQRDLPDSPVAVPQVAHATPPINS